MDLSPIVLSLLAGLSTSIGALIAISVRKTRFCYLCIVFGFSAGVMIFISFTELLSKGIQSTGMMFAFMSFFAGILIIYLIDVLVPHAYEKDVHKSSRVKRTATLLFLGIAIHNFPEGMAVLFSSFSDIKLGVLIAIAIALHNIPEGIAVSMPVFYATKSKRKAFIYSTLSGLAEPVGALFGLFVFYPFLNSFVLGMILSAVAGIMVFISFDELLPYVYSQRDSGRHFSILGLFLGMFTIALTLLVV